MIHKLPQFYCSLFAYVTNCHVMSCITYMYKISFCTLYISACTQAIGDKYYKGLVACLGGMRATSMYLHMDYTKVWEFYHMSAVTIACLHKRQSV